MAITEEPLILNLRVEKPSGTSRFKTQPKYIDDWYDNLPRAHLGEFSRAVYSALLETNQAMVPNKERFYFLQKVTTFIDEIIHVFQEKYVDVSAPLSVRNIQLVKLIREILTELTTGYKIIISINHAQNSLFSSSSLLIDSIYYSLLHMHQALTNEYLVYTAAPPLLWEELHALYYFSRVHNLNKKTVNLACTRTRKEDRCTIESIYLQTLLLALANPYQLSQGGTLSIKKSLKYWVPFCKLYKPHKDTKPEGLFAVDLKKDDPPCFHGQLELDSEYFLMLDTSLLTKEIRELLLSPSGQAGDSLVSELQQSIQFMPKTTLKRLLLSWGLLSKRQYPRHKTSHTVDVVIGLTSVHHYISDLSNESKSWQRPVQFESKLKASSYVDDNWNNQWDFGPRVQATVIKNKATNLMESTELTAVSSSQAHHYRLNTVNESAGGYCLFWELEGDSPLNVDDLLCVIESTDKPQNYTLCVIRWMRKKDDVIIIGSEVLTPTAEAIRIKLAQKGIRKEDFSYALLLPEIDALNRPKTIITSSFFHKGRKVLLHQGNSQKHIQLSRLMQSNKRFKQFQYETIKPNKEK